MNVSIDQRTIQLVDIISIEDHHHVNMVDLTVDGDESFTLANGIISHNSARKSIHEARGKNPYIGSFALRGKPLNITDSETTDILKNNEIKNILKIVGLKIGEPVKSVKSLRFGKIVILSDQDLDGFHISSLLMNLFAYFWPELFEMGVIYRLNTPLVIAELKNKEELNFMTDEDYEEWVKKGIKHEARRFKGLGSYTIPRFKKIIEQREKFLIRLSAIEQPDTDGLALAFKGDMADERKDWLSGVSYFDKFDE